MPRLFEYQARLERVVDGDTVDLMVDCGYGIYTLQRFRLAGIDCPELRRGSEEQKAAGRAAKEFVEELLGQYDKLFIVTEKDKKDGFGRYIAHLYNITGEVYLNELIVLQGHAVYKEY